MQESLNQERKFLRHEVESINQTTKKQENFSNQLFKVIMNTWPSKHSSTITQQPHKLTLHHSEISLKFLSRTSTLDNINIHPFHTSRVQKFRNSVNKTYKNWPKKDFTWNKNTFLFLPKPREKEELKMKEEIKARSRFSKSITFLFPLPQPSTRGFVLENAFEHQ